MISKEYYDSLPDVVRVKVDKFQSLTDAGMYPYASTKYVRTTTAKAITEDFESLNGQHVSIAGRVMAKRGQGKVSFWDLQDSDGRVQLFVKRDTMGEEEYKLGDVWNGVTNEALREDFRSCNAYARPECADCWAKLYCSGGCAANAYHATGSIRGVYQPGCELFRKRIECAIMMKVAEEDLQED